MFFTKVLAALCVLEICLAQSRTTYPAAPSLAHLVFGPGGRQPNLRTPGSFYLTNRVRDFDDRVFFENISPVEPAQSVRPLSSNDDRILAPAQSGKPLSSNGDRSLAPAVEAVTRTTTPASAENEVSANAIPSGPRSPSRCVWAIVSCCTPQSSRVRHACFETLGCQGPFWDNSPCDGRFAQSAAKTALDFYSTG